eukprot:380722_1
MENRSAAFFNSLTDDINKFKSNCHNLFVIGDFNARMAHYTNDKTKNKHFDNLEKLMHNTGIKIGNPKFAPGILTCLSKDKNKKGVGIDGFGYFLIKLLNKNEFIH